MNTIKDLVTERDRIEAELEKAIRLKYPVGCTVTYETAGTRLHCKVVDHGFLGRVCLVNVFTGKRRWVHGDSTSLEVTQ